MSNFPEVKKHAYCEEALKMEGQARLLFLKLGERLYNIREERLYEPFWTDWQVFCMEFKDLSPSAIFKIIQVYEIFVLQFHYKPEKLAKAGGWTKLYSLTTHIKTKKDAEHWLSLAEQNPQKALKEYITEAKTGVDMRDCGHKEKYTVEICKHCGRRIEKV